MMDLYELLTMLLRGELRNFSVLYLGEAGRLDLSSYAYPPEDKAKLYSLIDCINLGLVDLYTRFTLQRGRQEFDYSSDTKRYTITDEDFIEVLEVSLNDSPLAYNVDYRLDKINELYIDKLRHYNTPFSNTLVVTYKAKHPTLNYYDLTQEVNLPSMYLNALSLFCAMKMYASSPNQLDGDLHEGVRYQQRYYEEISKLTNDGVDIDGMNEFKLFNLRGFV